MWPVSQTVLSSEAFREGMFSIDRWHQRGISAHTDCSLLYILHSVHYSRNPGDGCRWKTQQISWSLKCAVKARSQLNPFSFSFWCSIWTSASERHCVNLRTFADVIIWLIIFLCYGWCVCPDCCFIPFSARLKNLLNNLLVMHFVWDI